MTTLYSAATTINGKKVKGARMDLGHGERYALQALAASIVAVNDLKPAASDIRCGVRLPKTYCQTVAEGLTTLLGLDDEVELTISGVHVKALFNIQKRLNAILDGKTAKSAEVVLSEEAIGQLIQAGETLSAYKDDQVGSININNYAISRAKLVEVIKFIGGVKRSVLVGG